MSMPESIVQTQTDALLRRVAREQEARCRRARDAAEEQARGIVGRAWEEARARLRQAVGEERRAIDKALADRRAALETVARQREQAILRELMDEAWRDMPATLDEEWRRPEGRRNWCASACSLAEQALSHADGFVVELDPAAPDDAATTVEQRLRTSAGTRVELKRVAALGPGLRIRCGRACVDATVPGLLSSRERIESELLAEFERLLEAAKEA